MTRSAARDGRLDALMEQLARPRTAAVSRTRAEEALGRRGVAHAMREGTLVEILPRVLVAGARADEHLARCQAAVLWGEGRIYISGASALRLECDRFEEPRTVHAVGPRGYHPQAPPWLRIRRTGVPDLYVNRLGVRCVLGEEAVVDAWTRARPRDRQDLLYVALWARVAWPGRLAEVVATTARLPSRYEMDSILGEFAAGARSPGEVLARRRVFVGSEFAELERSAEFHVAGRNRFPDLVHRRARLVVECDGDAYHGTPGAVAADRQRDADFLEIGYSTLRFGFTDLRTRPEWCRRKLRGVLRSRLGGSEPSPGVASR
ncbi:endonuclease domain-containing protein [Demequina pelophila]|uniref:endonuclease domain-containing protein n=1 Tax=Demequina pelophila TaxID=1638984 RepID=UPI00078209D0|nr:DUF559 domain-containing protein [Demequina pelophila]